MNNFLEIFAITIFLIYSSTGISQNILKNGSFESWIEDQPMDLTIVTDSPDFYKRRTRIYPAPFWDDSIPKYFPQRGSDGISYLGLHSTIATVESVALKLESKLQKGTRYSISCSARRLELPSYRYFDSLAYSITDSIPIQLNRAERDRGGFSSVSTTEFRRRINISGFLSKTSSRKGWNELEDSFIAEGNERYLIVFPPLPTSSDSIYYLLYDNFVLEKSISLDFSTFYESSKSSLTLSQQSEIDSWLLQLPHGKVDSLVVKGYTDTVGEIKYNQSLSENRALTVADYINSKQQVLHINTYGLGESKLDLEERDKRKVIIRAYIKPLISQVEAIDASIFQRLDIAYTNDQKFRSINPDDEICNSEIARIDNENKHLLTELFDNYGYLGVSKLNSEMKDYMAIMTLHQDLEFQIKYLPIIEEASDYRECSPDMIAYLIDKVKVARKEKQIFGTQMFYSEKEKKFKPYPISQESKVNIRRKEYGLGKLENYIESFN